MNTNVTWIENLLKHITIPVNVDTGFFNQESSDWCFPVGCLATNRRDLSRPAQTPIFGPKSAANNSKNSKFKLKISPFLRIYRNKNVEIIKISKFCPNLLAKGT